MVTAIYKTAFAKIANFSSFQEKLYDQSNVSKTAEGN